MRYRDFASDKPTTYKHRCNIATLHVLDGEWAELKQIRQAHGPTRITAVRSLAPRFKGFSVEVMCRSEKSATDLLVAWCNPSALQKGSREASASITCTTTKP
jgi:hypothetical protein